MNRREMVRKVILGGSSLFLVRVAESCSGDEDAEDEEIIAEIDLNDPFYSRLKTVNESAVIRSAHVIVANHPYLGFIAASCICSHEGCRIQFNPDPSGPVIWKCPCHNSAFQYRGEVVCSPATQALETFDVIRAVDIITVKRKH